MSNYTVDPNTGILVPTPGVDPGEDYAVNVSNALTKLSSLTHTGASNSDGLQIPSAGLNINADVSFQSNNATNLRSARLASNGSNISGAGDVNCIYDVSGNLWFNNGSGTQIQLTNGSTLAVTTSDQFAQQATTTNLTIASNSVKVSILVHTASGALTITLPTAGAAGAGRYFVIDDADGQANTNNITIRTAGGDTIEGLSSYTITARYGSVMLVSDGSSSWTHHRFAQLNFNNTEYLNFNSGSTLTINSGATLDGYGTIYFTGPFTSTGTNALSGTISLTATNINVGGNLLFTSNLSSAAVQQATPTTDVACGNLYLQAADAWTSASTHQNGGAVTISSGNATGIGAFGNLTLNVGHGAFANPILIGSGLSGNTSISAAASSSSNAGITILNNNNEIILGSALLGFANNTGNCGIRQDPTTSAGGSTMTIIAQSTSHTGSGGGNLVLAAGIGPLYNGGVEIGVGANTRLSVSDSQVRMMPGSGVTTIGSSLSVAAFNGSVNTQLANNLWTPVMVSTAAGGSNALVQSITIPNSTGVFVEFIWFRRDTIGGTSAAGWGGNRGSFTAMCNSSGTITTSALQQVYSATHYDSISGVTLATASNNVSLYAVAQSSADDWQFLVCVSAC
jgi:hypothetical protein